jgi:uncharacterized membrane protein YccC
VSVPDFFPPVLNAVRAVLTVGSAALFWILTGWPDGATAIVFAAVAVLLFSPRAYQAYPVAIGFVIGTAMAAVVAAIVGFAILPQQPSYAGFCMALGVALVPLGAVVATSWKPEVFIPAVANFIPLLSPANQMSYNAQNFYNSALAIIAGTCIAVLWIRLLPPLSPVIQTRRLLALTLGDLRRLVTGPVPDSAAGWEGLINARLAALPEQPDLLPRSQLVAALSLGTEIIRVRRVAGRFDIKAKLHSALDHLVRGDSAMAIAALKEFDAELAAIPDGTPGATTRLRVRAAICAVEEALIVHAAFFDGR